MPSLSNVSRWRGDKPDKTYGYLYIWKPPRVFEARLNLPTASYPLTALPYDGVTNGSYTAIVPGMTLMLGSAPGKDDYGRQRVSDTATNSSIPIGRSSEGKHAGELNALDNAYITVIDLHEVWAKVPYITETGTSSKDGRNFSASIAQPPIANGGPAVIGFVNDDDELIVDFTAAQSQIVDAGASSLTYSWNFHPGTSSSQTPSNISFGPGQRYVDLTVNDGTRAHTTHIPVVALERSGENAPIPAVMTGRKQQPEGQTINFEVEVADLPVADYPYGTLLIFFQDEWYGPNKGSLSGTAGRQNVKFVGWLATESHTDRATAKGMSHNVTLSALDVAGRLSKLPGFGQRVQHKASPANWQEMANANVDRYLHYLLYWHSTALEVSPFKLSGAGANYPFMDLGSDGQNLYAQVDQRARAIAHRLTCNTRGELKVKADPQRQLSGNRTPTVIVALDQRDWKAKSYEIQWHPRVHWKWGSAIVASNTAATAVFAVAPGATPGQGEGPSDSGEQLVLSQYELNWRLGMDYERDNLVLVSLTLELAHGGDAGIDPAEMEWVTLGWDVTLSGPRQVVYPSGTRWLVLEVNNTLDPRKATSTVTLRLEPEVIGFEADAYTPKTPGELPPTAPWVPPGSPYDNLPVDPGIVYPPIPFTPILPPVNPLLPPVLDKTGNLVLISTPTDVILIQNYKLWLVNSSVPVNYHSVVPVLPDGYTVRQSVPSGFGSAVYSLMSDGDESILAYCPNVTAGVLEWSYSEPIPGEFSQIQTTDTEGKVYIKGTSETEEEGDTWTHTYNFLESDCGFTGRGSWEYGVGWKIVNPVDTFPYFGHIGLYSPEFPSTTITGMSFSFWNTYDIEPGGLNITDATIDLIPAPSIFGGYEVPVRVGAYTVSDTYVYPYFTEKTGTYLQMRLKPSIDPGQIGDAGFTSFTITGLGPNPFPIAPFRTLLTYDYGVTFEDPEPIGIEPPGGGGMNAIKIGNVAFSGASGQIMRVEDNGAWEEYGDPMPDNANPSLILVPRYRPGGTTNNIDTDTPQMIVGSTVAGGDDDDEALWIVTGGGTVFGDITPVDEDDVPGTSIGPHSAITPYLSGARLAGIFDFDGTRRLYTRVNTTWTERSALSDDAHYIRMRKGDKNLKELYIANGALAVYSPNFGTNLYSKNIPVVGDIVSLEVFG